MLLWTKSNRRTCKLMLITPHVAYIFVKRNVRKKGHGSCALFHNHNYQGATGNLSTKLNVLQQTAPLKCDRLQSHTMPCIFCSNYPAILWITAIASYVAI